MSSSEPQVGDKWYRYEDKWYSVADEWGEHAYSTLRIELRLSYVGKVTPKGVWLTTFPIVPGGRQVHEIHPDSKKFIAHSWTKKYACATKEEALESLIARRKRQKSIYETRARAAEEVLFMVEMQRKTLLEQKGY